MVGRGDLHRLAGAARAPVRLCRRHGDAADTRSPLDFSADALVRAGADLLHRRDGPDVPRRCRAHSRMRPSTRSIACHPGDPVLLSFDYDPASEGELGPMATAFVKHCAEKKLKMYFMALWPVGPQMVDNTIDKVIRSRLPESGLRPGLRQPRLQVGIRRRHQGHRDQHARAVHDRCARHGHPGHSDDEGHHQRAADEADHQRFGRISRREGVGAVRRDPVP